MRINKIKIAYLDDDAELCKLFVDLYSSPVVEIRTYHDPKSALDEIISFAPNLAFIDYDLSEYTGEQIAHLLPPQIGKVLVTGHLNMEVPDVFIKVFFKPYEISDVEDYISELMSV